MSRLRDSAVRLVNLFRRERIERELDAELQAYLELASRRTSAGAWRRSASADVV